MGDNGACRCLPNEVVAWPDVVHVSVVSLLSYCFVWRRRGTFVNAEAKILTGEAVGFRRVRNLCGAFLPNFTSRAPHLLHSSGPSSCYQIFFSRQGFPQSLSCLFRCLVLPESSSSVCKEPNFCQSCHQKFHLQHACMSPEHLPKFCPNLVTLQALWCKDFTGGLWFLLRNIVLCVSGTSVTNEAR